MIEFNVEIFPNARYGAAYWLEMTQLGCTYPWLHNQLVAKPGIWTVQRQSQYGFASTSGDQTIEQTINRESKSSGGVKGITLSRGK